MHHMRALSSDTRVGAIQRQLQSELEGLGHLSESIRMADCEPGLFEVVEHRIECLAEVRSWLRYGLDYRPDWYGDLGDEHPKAATTEGPYLGPVEEHHSIRAGLV